MVLLTELLRHGPPHVMYDPLDHLPHHLRWNIRIGICGHPFELVDRVDRLKPLWRLTHRIVSELFETEVARSGVRTELTDVPLRISTNRQERAGAGVGKGLFFCLHDT